MITRWVCEKDKKKWIYPIEKCIYCKGPVEKIVSREAKVIGITKVNVPSLAHHIVPYNVILLEDEHGNRMPKKTMREYNIGDSYVEPKASSEDAVSVVGVKYDIYEAVKHAIGLVNESGFFTPDSRFLIKPGIPISASPYQAATTNPEVVDAVIQ